MSGGEAVLTQGTGAGLACPSEGSGVELGVYLSPGCKLEPSCLFSKGDIIGQASAKIVFHIAGCNNVHVCYEVRTPNRLVGSQVVGVNCVTPHPV